MKNALVLTLTIVTGPFLCGCANKEEKAINEFGQHYLEAQHDYCSTNVFVAQQGLVRF